MPILGILASAQTSSSLSSFESIASATGTGSSGTITFSSIPSTYQHLQIRWVGRTSSLDRNDEELNIRFNSDTGSNYWQKYMQGSGTTTGRNSRDAVANAFIGSATTDLLNGDSLGVGIIDLQDYASTSKKKIFRANNSWQYLSGAVYFISGVWNSTSAISSISIYTANGGNFTTDTVFSLYGIKGA